MTKVSWILGDLRKDGTLTSRKSYRWAETDLAIWDTTTASNFGDGMGRKSSFLLIFALLKDERYGDEPSRNQLAFHSILPIVSSGTTGDPMTCLTRLTVALAKKVIVLQPMQKAKLAKEDGDEQEDF